MTPTPSIARWRSIHSERKTRRTSRWERCWRLLGALMLALGLGSGLFVAQPVRPTLAADASGLTNERVIYRGSMYETYVSTTNDPMTNGAIVVCRKNLNSDACAETINLDGKTLHHPVLAADSAGNFLTILVRGVDNALYWRSKVKDGDTYGPANQMRGGFGFWQMIPSNEDDEPAAYGGEGFVSVDWRSSNGYKYRNRTTDGINFTTTAAISKGLDMPLGTNILNGSLSNGGSLSPADTGAIQALHPGILRVRMFLEGSPLTPRFSTADLNYFRDQGVRTLIINGSEGTIDYTTLKAQLGKDLGGGDTILSLSRAYNDARGVNIFFELGNETDRVYVKSGFQNKYSAAEERKAALASVRQFTAEYGGAYPNLRLMISLPTRNPLDTTQAAADQYFNDFLAPQPDGPDQPDQGKRVGYEFSAVAVHAYAQDCLSVVNPTNGQQSHAGEGNPDISPIDIVKAAVSNTNRPIYITEAGIGADVTRNYQGSYQAKWDDLGKKYVDGLGGFDLPNGRVRGVTYFQTALSDINPDYAELNIDADYTGGTIHPTTGYVAHTHMRQRDSGDCSSIGEQTSGFVAASIFRDVPGYLYGFPAIQTLAARNIARGYQDGSGNFGPTDAVLRAQMAAFIVRAMHWDGEDHPGYPTFTDRCDPQNPSNCIDNELWRDIGTLEFRQVVTGYKASDCTAAGLAAPCYGPRDPVLQVQAVSFVTRAMVVKGNWTGAASDNPQIYPNVPASSGHRLDLVTYCNQVGPVPGTPSCTVDYQGYDSPATRATFALMLAKALNNIGEFQGFMTSLTASATAIDGTTTVAWDTGDGTPGQLYMATGDEGETLLATAPSGSQAVSLAPGTSAAFRFYPGTAHVTEAAAAVVTNPQSGTATLTASPNPTPDGTTTVAWDTGDGAPGELYAATDDGGEALVATGASGAQSVTIAPGGATIYRLYAGTGHSAILAAVTVTHAP